MPTIDEHPLRYTVLRNKIEDVLSRRTFEKRLDGYTLETSLELAELFEQFKSGCTCGQLTHKLDCPASGKGWTLPAKSK